MDKFIFALPNQIYNYADPIKDKYNVLWYPAIRADGSKFYLKADECGIIEQLADDDYKMVMKKDNIICVLCGNSIAEVIEMYFNADPLKLALGSQDV